MIYGYARCSTSEKEQDIDRQKRELKELGATAETIYFEYESGTKVWRICGMKKYELLNTETIKKAITGDSAAIQKVISHYTQYTRYFSKNYGVLNYDIADEIQTHLMRAVLKFHIRKE